MNKAKGMVKEKFNFHKLIIESDMKNLHLVYRHTRKGLYESTKLVLANRQFPVFDYGYGILAVHVRVIDYKPFHNKVTISVYVTTADDGVWATRANVNCFENGVELAKKMADEYLNHLVEIPSVEDFNAKLKTYGFSEGANE